MESVLEKEKWGLFRERKETMWRGREDILEIKTIFLKGCQDGSAVKSTQYSCRGPGFDPQHNHL